MNDNVTPRVTQHFQPDSLRWVTRGIIVAASIVNSVAAPTQPTFLLYFYISSAKDTQHRTHSWSAARIVLSGRVARSRDFDPTYGFAPFQTASVPDKLLGPAPVIATSAMHPIKAGAASTWTGWR